MLNNLRIKLRQLYFKDTQFANLMTKRIFNVLLVANPYDAFMLEDDGRVEEKIYNEYVELGLRYPPTFTQVSTTEEAREVLRTREEFERLAFDCLSPEETTQLASTLDRVAARWMEIEAEKRGDDR